MFRRPLSRLLTNGPLVHHTVFDFYECEQTADRVNPQRNDSNVDKIFHEKAISLAPTEDELDGLKNLHEKVKECLTNYISQKILFGSIVVVSCHDIGSLKMSTLLSGHATSDLMCVFSGPVSLAQMDIVAQKILADLTTQFPSESFTANKDEMPNIEISVPNFKVKLWPVSEKIAGHDPALHISKSILTYSRIAIRHSEWFCQHSSNGNVARVVLLLKDLRRRFEGLKPLTPWLLCMLAHYCVARMPDRTPINLHSSFRRCLKYMASGIFLPNSVGILDTCEAANTRSHLILSLADQDLVCLTAQYLVNVGSIFGYQRLLEPLETRIAGPDDCVITLGEPTQF